MGPLILDCISKSITEELFPTFVTKGAIVLLRKKDDHKLLGNKRPITLLNYVYKIGAKAMQWRLAPILQKIISPQQSAFLLGLNIHHNLLLLSEMLHRAHECGEDHILMKLDVCKAFHRLEWPFILAAVEKAGRSGRNSFRFPPGGLQFGVFCHSSQWEAYGSIPSSEVGETGMPPLTFHLYSCLRYVESHDQ